MQLAIATITLEHHGDNDLMMSSLEEMADRGHTVFVGDGGSSAAFTSRITAMGHVVLQPGRRMRGQVEAALEAASESGSHVLYVESDKQEFVHDRLDRTLASYRRRGVEFASCGRNRTAFETFPFEQREIERAESALIGSVLGIRGDWVAGPVIMPAEHVRCLRDSKFYGSDRHGWGVNWFLLGRAWKKGLQVGNIPTAPGVHTSAESEFNPGYRLYQANAILGCFYDGAGIDYDWHE